MSLSSIGRKEFGAIDRLSTQMHRGIHRHGPTVESRRRLDYCNFCKCGNCGESQIFWKWLSILEGLKIRECDVCGEKVNLLTSRGHLLTFTVKS
jgi:uncharacterized protein (DUF983 family)